MKEENYSQANSSVKIYHLKLYVSIDRKQNSTTGFVRNNKTQNLLRATRDCKV